SVRHNLGCVSWSPFARAGLNQIPRMVDARLWLRATRGCEQTWALASVTRRPLRSDLHSTRRAAFRGAVQAAWRQPLVGAGRATSAYPSEAAFRAQGRLSSSVP